ncbi:MAG: methylated-DNA--[protein]-cysteine S-methyltransferase [Nocardioidaceae bacterium]
MSALASPATSVTDLLGALDPVDDETTKRLHARLVAAAQADGILDVAYRTLDTPVGTLLVAATDAGLVRVAFARQDHDAVLAALADQVSPRVLLAPARLERVARELDEYFEGQRTGFDVRLDLRLARGFRREVLLRLTDIGFGATASYAAVAVATGHPKAARAVGTACRVNPLPVVVPCHRVVRADGSVGEYAGGAAAKRRLLDLEAANGRDRRC